MIKFVSLKSAEFSKELIDEIISFVFVSMDKDHRVAYVHSH
jgi:hypothetical protein